MLAKFYQPLEANSVATPQKDKRLDTYINS